MQEGGEGKGAENTKACLVDRLLACIKFSATTYSPALSSTIGSPGLNDSVRNGKR